jgi:acyl-coenzyme A synthetase/AMP-(fatty) acid ligase
VIGAPAPLIAAAIAATARRSPAMSNPVEAHLPLFAHSSPEATLAFTREGPVDAHRYLADVVALSRRLPDTPDVLNVCGDRYAFAVGLGAALLRGQRTLLPANHAPATLERLARNHPGLYALTDAASPEIALPVFAVTCGDDPRTAPFDVPHIARDQTAAILFTSGSTGEPVPTAKTWGALVQSGRCEASALGFEALPRLAILGTVPAQHSYGLESTVLLALHGGFAFHADKPFFPADVCAALAALPRPRMLVTTPVHLRALCSADAPVPEADYLLSATAPLSPQLAAEAERRFHAPLNEIYGCSEAGQLATRRLLASPQWRSMRGIRLRQDARGTWASGGHVPGEILLADVIELVDEERFILHGRSADLVNIAGKRTSLAHLDLQLNALEGVRDGAFLVPDGDADHVVRLVAFAVAPGRRAQEILAGLQARIDPAFLPRPLYLVDALPRNATGKIPREALLALAARLQAARTAP